MTDAGSIYDSSIGIPNSNQIPFRSQGGPTSTHARFNNSTQAAHNYDSKRKDHNHDSGFIQSGDEYYPTLTTGYEPIYNPYDECHDQYTVSTLNIILSTFDIFDIFFFSNLLSNIS